MLSYVSSHTSTLIPKVRHVFPDPGSRTWIVMDYIDGTTLETEWPRMSWWKWLYTVWLACRCVQELHNVPKLNPDIPGCSTILDSLMSVMAITPKKAVLVHSFHI
jgi:serine/threonine protein kinase